MSTHDPERGLRFGSVAELYDDVRPRPPLALVERYDPLSGARVVDLGAGTGLLSRFLAKEGAQVTAIEPDRQMLAVLVARSSEVTAVCGTAHAIPLANERADIVTCSSAWHWFAQPDTAREIARVLVDHGRLVVVWNGFDRRCTWLSSLMALREPTSEHDAPPRHRVRTVELDPSLPFTPVEHTQLHWTWERSIDEMISLFHTYSGVIARTDEERHELDRHLRSALEDQARDGIVSVPMSCGIFVTTRRQRDAA